MDIPFTSEEIKAAASRLGKNKSPDSLGLQAEHILYATTEIHCEIATILNEVAKTGTFPRELKHGLLVPLQKPGKSKEPVENTRPIILLSILRKILATCLIKRISEKLNQKIPMTQAAYQKGRSTTEHVLSIKLLCQKKSKRFKRFPGPSSAS